MYHHIWTELSCICSPRQGPRDPHEAVRPASWTHYIQTRHWWNYMDLAPVSSPIIKDNFNYIWWKRWWYFWPEESVMAASRTSVMEWGRQDERHLERWITGSFDWLDCVCAHAHLRLICMKQMHTCGIFWNAVYLCCATGMKGVWLCNGTVWCGICTCAA